MNREVCGICWGAYDEDGRCECAPAPVVRDDTALLRRALEKLETLQVKVDWEWGDCRDLEQLEADQALWSEIVELRERLK